MTDPSTRIRAVRSDMPAAQRLPRTAPVKRRTFEDICDGIRERIANGTLKAGDKLPAEREMAEQLGVGRNAVREAFRSLEMAGVIRLEKGRNGGAFIRPANASRVTHAMRDLLDIGSISWNEMTEARTLVLDQVVRLACERATPEDLDLIEHELDEIDQLTKAGQFEERSERAMEFYSMLAGTVANGVLLLLVTSMSDILRRFVEIASREGRRPVESLVATRRRILRHIRDHDPERAAAELRIDLQRIHKSMEAKVKSSPVRASRLRIAKS